MTDNGSDNAPGLWPKVAVLECENERLKARVTDLEASYRGAKHDAEYFEARLAELEANQRVTEFADKFIADNPGSFPSIDEMEKTIHSLRARVAEQEEQLQAYETQLTLQEDGPRPLLERLEKQKRDLDYYAGREAELEDIIEDKFTEADLLRGRVAELEAQLAGKYVNWVEATNERDQLRTQVRDITSMWTTACAELQALKPKPVTEEST